MKKTIGVLIVTAILLLGTMGASAMELAVLNTQSVERGILSVNYQIPAGRPMKLMLENGGERMFFNLLSDRTEESFPLTMGDGKYRIAFLEHVSGNQFRNVKSKTLQVNITDINALYLGSVQEIRWNEDMEAIKMAAALTKNASTDKEKVEAIYNYIVTNMRYDHAKIPTLTSTYLPDVEKTFVTKKGICYDFASLFAAMVRSVGIPARMAKGYAPGIQEYHAWNEVLIDGQWETVDTTMDMAFRQAGVATQMFKNSAEFNKTSAL